jgi:tol-pal system protein YbgF
MLGTALVLGACATTPPDKDPVQIKLNALDTRLARIERVVENQSLLQLSNDLEAARADIRSLHNDVDELSHNLDAARRQQRDLYADLDKRLRVVETRRPAGAAAPDAGAGGAVTDSGGAHAGSSTAGPSTGTAPGEASPGATGARTGEESAASEAGAAGSVGAAASESGAAGSVGAAASVTGAAAAAEDSANVPPGGDHANYQAAFSLLKDNQYDKAIKAFRQFLVAFPDSSLAGNAQYWLGEAYYVNRDLVDALSAFQGVADKYPSSSKLPDALLKIGYCRDELKQFDQAKAVLNDVATRFGDTPAGTLAKLRLQQIGTEKH